MEYLQKTPTEQATKEQSKITYIITQPYKQFI